MLAIIDILMRSLNEIKTAKLLENKYQISSEFEIPPHGDGK